MPSRFWGDTSTADSLSKAPLPLQSSSVNIEQFEQSADFLAVTWFGGFCSGSLADRKAQFLREMIEKEEPRRWRIKNEDSGLKQNPLVLQYNDPFQPPWKRRNEVAIPVVKCD